MYIHTVYSHGGVYLGHINDNQLMIPCTYENDLHLHKDALEEELRGRGRERERGKGEDRVLRKMPRLFFLPRLLGSCFGGSSTMR